MTVNDYLARITESKDISEDMRSVALMIYWHILRLYENIPEPDMAPSPDGDLLYVWESLNHHFEVEILAKEDRVELFYWNRLTDETREGYLTVPEFLELDKNSLLSKLELFMEN